MEKTELAALRDDLRGYHDDVKRRLTIVEDDSRELRRAIYGEAGNEVQPGLHVQVQGLLGFRERVRVGIGSAWAFILAIVSVWFTKK